MFGVSLTEKPIINNISMLLINIDDVKPQFEYALTLLNLVSVLSSFYLVYI